MTRNLCKWLNIKSGPKFIHVFCIFNHSNLNICLFLNLIDLVPLIVLLWQVLMYISMACIWNEIHVRCIYVIISDIYVHGFCVNRKISFSHFCYIIYLKYWYNETYLNQTSFRPSFLFGIDRYSDQKDLIYQQFSYCYWLSLRLRFHRISGNSGLDLDRRHSLLICYNFFLQYSTDVNEKSPSTMKVTSIRICSSQVIQY